MFISFFPFPSDDPFRAYWTCVQRTFGVNVGWCGAGRHIINVFNTMTCSYEVKIRQFQIRWNRLNDIYTMELTRIETEHLRISDKFKSKQNWNSEKKKRMEEWKRKWELSLTQNYFPVNIIGCRQSLVASDTIFFVQAGWLFVWIVIGMSSIVIVVYKNYLYKNIYIYINFHEIK